MAAEVFWGIAGRLPTRASLLDSSIARATLIRTSTFSITRKKLGLLKTPNGCEQFPWLCLALSTTLSESKGSKKSTDTRTTAAAGILRTAITTAAAAKSGNAARRLAEAHYRIFTVVVGERH